VHCILPLTLRRCHFQRHRIQHLLFYGSGAAAVDLGIQRLGEQGGELAANLAGEHIGSEGPVLQHQSIGQATVGNGIGGILLSLAALLTDRSNGHTLDGVEGRQVNGGQVGWHWPEPLWVSGKS